MAANLRSLSSLAFSLFPERPSTPPTSTMSSRSSSRRGSRGDSTGVTPTFADLRLGTSFKPIPSRVGSFRATEETVYYRPRVRRSLWDLFRETHTAEKALPDVLEPARSGTHGVKREKIRDHHLYDLARRNDLLITETDAPLSMVSLPALMAFLKVHGNSILKFNMQNAACLTSECFSSVFNKMPNLQELCLQYQHQICDENILSLLDSCPRLSSLKLIANNYMTTYLFHRLLSEDRTFDRLSLNIHWDKGDSFHGEVKLAAKELLLSGDVFKDADFDLIKRVKQLAELTLIMTNVTDEGVVSFLNEVQERHVFNTLKVVFNPSDPIGHRRLSRAIKANHVLRDIFKCTYSDSDKTVVISRKVSP
ncbi:MAG: hypothetical protein S4CHLAM37_02450 [Chlamydiia bacterium]|nr:hypothetical protein [Chlamydiia bacterium]